MITYQQQAKKSERIRIYYKKRKYYNHILVPAIDPSALRMQTSAFEVSRFPYKSRAHIPNAETIVRAVRTSISTPDTDDIHDMMGYHANPHVHTKKFVCKRAMCCKLCIEECKATAQIDERCRECKTIENVEDCVLKR